MADFVLYRKNGGRVEGVSKTDVYTGQIDTDFFDVYDTGIPGTDIANPPKFCNGATYRNATAPEIAAWAAKLDEDLDLLDKKNAKAEVTDRKVLRAFMLIVMDEINILRDEHGLAPRTADQLSTAIQNRIDGF